MATTLKLVRTEAEEALAAAFDLALTPPAGAEKAQQPLGTPDVIDARRKAMAVFLRDGLPHRRIEAWKYTDLRALLKTVPPLPPWKTRERVAEADKLALPLKLQGAPKLLMADGSFVPSARIPDGVAWAPLYDWLYDPDADTASLFANPAVPADNALVALNRAFFHDGAAFKIAPDAQIETPLHVAMVTAGMEPRFVNDRIVVDVGAGASVTLVESRVGENGVANLFNALVEFRLGDGARVEHVRCDAAGDRAMSFATLAVRLGRQAVFRSRSMPGGAVSRQQVFVRFEGEGAKLDLGGATLLRGSQHHDVTLVVDHLAPHGESRELYRTVLDDSATGVFQGRINVAKQAQKTDGRMASNALMLSDSATMNNKPELEIFADDVQCAHGATCGALDEDLLFYLRSRGISRKEAEGLMIRSFVGAAIDGLESEILREALGALADGWVAARV